MASFKFNVGDVVELLRISPTPLNSRYIKVGDVAIVRHINRKESDDGADMSDYGSSFHVLVRWWWS